MDALDKRRFSTLEFAFLDEYIMILKPLANTLDALQSDSASLGMVLPAIVKLEKFWNSKLSEGNLQVCEPLVKFLLWDLNERTSEEGDDFKNDKDYILGKYSKIKYVDLYLLND